MRDLEVLALENNQPRYQHKDNLFMVSEDADQNAGRLRRKALVFEKISIELQENGYVSVFELIGNALVYN